MIAELYLFLKSKYNLSTYLIVMALLFLLYYSYIMMMPDVPNVYNPYNSAIVVQISFIYYFLIFRKLFIQQHIKFLALNFEKYKQIFFRKIVVGILYFIIGSLLVYIGLALVFAKNLWIQEVFQLDNLFYFIILNFMCVLISFALTSYSQSIWIIFIVFGVILFEDNLRLLLENSFITKILFKYNYTLLFTEDNISSILISLAYIAVSLIVILNKNYKHEK